ncbi:protein translocase subunit SecF [Spirochaetia bacterium 38H-sp]|uniref:Protein-export membrane protein SecF n=1 Tax=Rarispira pelagica TaxID=3141764 RepID=A0ABU9UCU6_9SPIR
MKVVRFTKYRFIAITISLLIIIGGAVGTYLNGGFNLGIDFKAGMTEQVSIKSSSPVDIEEVRAALSGLDAQIQQVGDAEANEFIIKVKQEGNDDNFRDKMREKILSALSSAFGSSNVEERSSNYIGPRFSATLATQSVTLVLIAFLFMLVYVWFRFEFSYSIGAITALFHDTLMVLGIIGLTQLEFTTATIAAVLTIVGYSINDTIVVFDRIRENTTLLKEKPFKDIVNISITETLSRTLITSFTTFIAVAAIYVFATGEIQRFALTLMIGIIVGTYSSIFIASPIMMAIYTRKKKEEETIKEKKAIEAEKRASQEPVKEEKTIDNGTPAGEALVSGKKKVPRSKRKKKK